MRAVQGLEIFLKQEGFSSSILVVRSNRASHRAENDPINRNWKQEIWTISQVGSRYSADFSLIPYRFDQMSFANTWKKGVNSVTAHKKRKSFRRNAVLFRYSKVAYGLEETSGYPTWQTGFCRTRLSLLEPCGRIVRFTSRSGQRHALISGSNVLHSIAVESSCNAQSSIRYHSAGRFGDQLANETNELHRSRTSVEGTVFDCSIELRAAAKSLRSTDIESRDRRRSISVWIFSPPIWSIFRIQE
ncbi:unnamed protein product [Nesidiocoris tenuis]|uniref:Uncharacterized protein n=1 Tax=Nesidiocoris tenuis TaxID=355587 RepID=A0A6H5GZD1_9HEMI|nr:unnamed protein product [Nesidiocoris tenuis]